MGGGDRKTNTENREPREAKDKQNKWESRTGGEGKNKQNNKKEKEKEDETREKTESTPASWQPQLRAHLCAKGLGRPPRVCSGRLIAFPSSSLSH